MLRLEKYLVAEKPALVLIPGDTNSDLAGALTPVKLGIPVAHIEAGDRCYDTRARCIVMEFWFKRCS